MATQPKYHFHFQCIFFLEIQGYVAKTEWNQYSVWQYKYTFTNGGSVPVLFLALLSLRTSKNYFSTTTTLVRALVLCSKELRPNISLNTKLTVNSNKQKFNDISKSIKINVMIYLVMIEICSFQCICFLSVHGTVVKG